MTHDESRLRWSDVDGDLERVEDLRDVDYDAPVLPRPVVHAFVHPFGGHRAELLALGDVLDEIEEAGRLLVVDHRTPIAEALGHARTQLSRAGRGMNFDTRGLGGAEVRIGKRKAHVSYLPVEGDEFDAVVRKINRLASPAAEYRRARASLSSDTSIYALLSSEGWDALERRYPHLTALMFVAVA